MRMIFVNAAAIAAVALCWPASSFAQNGPAEAIEARCKAAHFQDSDRAACAREQRAAIADFSPVIQFIGEHEYLAQSVALIGCMEASKDYYGQNYVEWSACYEKTVSASCKGNEKCLGNSTIAGIKQHISNGTKP